MKTLHIFSNRHICEQLFNVGQNDCIILENQLSLNRWKLFFRHNNIDERKLNITYITEDDYYKNGEGMKFDNVVGNPPYTDSGPGKTPIWHKFVLSQNTKNMTWVIPNSWMSSDVSMYKKVREHFLKNGLKEIKVNPIDTFTGATVRTVTVLCEAGYRGDISILDKSENYILNRTNLHQGILLGGTKIGTNIIYKLLPSNPLKAKNNKKIPLLKSENESKKGTIKVLSSLSKYGNKYVYASIDDINILQDPNRNKHRLVVGYLPSGTNFAKSFGVMNYVSDNNIVVPSYYRYFVRESKKEVESLKFFLQSKLVSFIQTHVRTSQTLDNSQLRFIPDVPPPHIDTDEELYDHFGLSEEERNYIDPDRQNNNENTVKD